MIWEVLTTGAPFYTSPETTPIIPAEACNP